MLFAGWEVRMVKNCDRVSFSLIVEFSKLLKLLSWRKTEQLFGPVKSPERWRPQVWILEKFTCHVLVLGLNILPPYFNGRREILNLRHCQQGLTFFLLTEDWSLKRFAGFSVLEERNQKQITDLTQKSSPVYIIFPCLNLCNQKKRSEVSVKLKVSRKTTQRFKPFA